MFFNEAFADELPRAASEVAKSWDHLYNFVFWLSVFFFVLVIGAVVWMAIKYRYRPGVKAKYLTGSHLLEAGWTLVPTVLLLSIFVWGYSVYNDMTRPPTDALEIRVVAKQWLFQIYYPDGRSTVNEVFVPVNKPVRFIMSSEDVLHSMFIPDFRVKSDIVPGMYTSIWFEATQTGPHQIYCTQYCGASHSLMMAKVRVLDEKQWEAWTNGKKPELASVDPAVAGKAGIAQAKPLLNTSSAKFMTLAHQGETLAAKRGCFSCHSVDGGQKLAPSFKGVFGRKVTLTDGRVVLADENYLRESIEVPAAKVVQGYQPVMPLFKGQFTEPEMGAMLAYLKSLK